MNNNKLASNSNSNTNSTRQIPHHRIDEEETIYKKYELGRKLGQVCNYSWLKFDGFYRFMILKL